VKFHQGAYCLLLQVVREVGNHDLHLRRNTILRGSALALLTGHAGALRRITSSAFGRGLSSRSLVRGLSQRKDLSGDIGGRRLRRGGSSGFLSLTGLYGVRSFFSLFVDANFLRHVHL